MEYVLKISRFVRILLLLEALVFLVCAIYLGCFHQVHNLPTSLYIWGLEAIVMFEIITAITIALHSKSLPTPVAKPDCIGKVVHLKSGGPLMTVDEQDEATGFWYCIWFDNSAKQSSYFDPATLFQLP